MQFHCELSVLHCDWHNQPRSIITRIILTSSAFVIFFIEVWENSFQMSDFFVGAVFMSLFTSVTLIFGFCEIRLLVVFWLTLVLPLLDLLDRTGLGSVNSFLSKPRHMFGLNSDLESMGKVQLCVFNLEKSLQDSFIVDRT